MPEKPGPHSWAAVLAVRSAVHAHPVGRHPRRIPLAEPGHEPPGALGRVHAHRRLREPAQEGGRGRDRRPVGLTAAPAVRRLHVQPPPAAPGRARSPASTPPRCTPPPTPAAAAAGEVGRAFASRHQDVTWSRVRRVERDVEVERRRPPPRRPRVQAPHARIERERTAVVQADDAELARGEPLPRALRIGDVEARPRRGPAGAAACARDRTAPAGSGPRGDDHPHERRQRNPARPPAIVGRGDAPEGTGWHAVEATRLSATLTRPPAMPACPAASADDSRSVSSTRSTSASVDRWFTRPGTQVRASAKLRGRDPSAARHLQRALQRS